MGRHSGRFARKFSSSFRAIISSMMAIGRSSSTAFEMRDGSGGTCESDTGTAPGGRRATDRSSGRILPAQRAVKEEAEE